ncbi:conserved Plasmodium protein, unknown function [Plasmodium gallinaceum]|uniref:Uncharacterized protein n=1 Tax=Plasmodium gallinaceum TaxID=5849 RepID=A0A1J1GP14_PLAGA|nr:conserved Plasmodium protein, unknown function [Plasmodium gallinaceum]CRG94231.1 conserved Plasmodium protein, unknown function [Plasmodium gallinaceum]
MKSVISKNKKKDDEQLMKAKELKEKIESMKNDLVSKTIIMKSLKEQRENKLENIKKLEIENKTSYENFKNEYEQILNQYKNIEKEIYEMLNDLKMLSERSYIIEEKKKDLHHQIEEVECEIIKHSHMINDILIKIKEIFKKTHIQYQYEEDLKPLLIRLQDINKKDDKIK